MKLIWIIGLSFIAAGFARADCKPNSCTVSPCASNLELHQPPCCANPAKSSSDSECFCCLSNGIVDFTESTQWQSPTHQQSTFAPAPSLIPDEAWRLCRIPFQQRSVDPPPNSIHTLKERLALGQSLLI